MTQNKIIYGIPSTGKTTLFDALSLVGYNCQDTDIICQNSGADLNALGDWLSEEGNYDKVIDEAFDFLESHQDGILFTNLHIFKDDRCRECQVFLFVRNARSIHDIMHARDENLVLELSEVERWTENDKFTYLNDSKARENIIIHLKDNEYISDHYLEIGVPDLV